MAGGLLNLIATGSANIFLTGDPTKTFFRVAYSKYTNFGLQKFRIDYNGTRDLRLTEPSTFVFKMPRYADLLMDSYLVMTLPDIWSPIYPPIQKLVDTDGAVLNEGAHTDNKWVPYEFRWIEDLGAQMIQEIEIRCGSFVLARYSGDYISAMVDRDFTAEKKEVFKRMTGNVPELNNPAMAHKRTNTYPNAFYDETNPPTAGLEPSIRGRNIYVPLNTWFTMDHRCAFPMIALQYNELEISVTIRPIQDLFQVRDVLDVDTDYFYPYVRPDFNQERFQMYRFLQEPKKQHIATATNSDGTYPSGTYPDDYPTNYGVMDSTAYENRVNIWNADVHLISTYAFLSKDEARQFAEEEQIYLVKEVHAHKYENIYGTKKVKLETTGMVANWMWYFQRNDVNLRNEWANYTNWPYKNMPMDIQTPPDALLLHPADNGNIRFNTGFFVSGHYNVENHKEIMTSMAVLLDGKYRENTMPRGVFDYIEKYARTNGFAQEGIYCYQFCLETGPRIYQPSGAMNLGKFNNVEMEFITHTPEIDKVNSNYQITCNLDGDPIAIAKSNWRLYEYTYNLVVFEERYNILSFMGGNCGLMYAR
jgi:hypothetical protein